MSLRTGTIWCLGASVIPDRVIVTQTCTPKAAPASPFILLKCHHYSSDSIHLSMRLAGFLSTLHTKLLLLHYFGGNEALNSFTWIFQSLQRSSSSSQTRTKNSSTESYREQQNLVLRVTWKQINFFFPFHILITILLPLLFSVLITVLKLLCKFCTLFCSSYHLCHGNEKQNV